MYTEFVDHARCDDNVHIETSHPIDKLKAVRFKVSKQRKSDETNKGVSICVGASEPKQKFANLYTI